MKNKNGYDLEWLLDYEITQSTRHRRFVSLVMLSANGSTGKIETMLDGAFRDSDVFFSLDHAVAVLMGETERAGALEAIERYRETIGQTLDVQYAVASFPDDGKATSELMDIAYEQLDLPDMDKPEPNRTG